MSTADARAGREIDLSEADECAAREQERRLTSLGVPTRVRRALARPAFEERPAIALVRKWLASPASLLVLSGTVGAGKSVAAGWALDNNLRQETIELIGFDPIIQTRRLSGRWVLAEDLTKASDFSSDFWEPLRRVHLLVVDEVDPNWLDPKGHALVNFTGLLRRRYDDELRTLLTTNIPPTEWLRVYGDADGGRLRDRLREAERMFGESPLVSITTASMRGET